MNFASLMMERASHDLAQGDHSQQNDQQKDRLQAAFSVESFEQAVALAQGRLAALLKRQCIEGVSPLPPQRLKDLAQSLMRAETSSADGRLGHDRFAQILDLYLATGIKVRSPGYMARQFSSVLPVSAVFDMVTAMAPQPASFYEAGPLATIADHLMAEQFAPRLGWQTGDFAMMTTSGGSLANLTALLAARNDRVPGSWSQGLAATTQGGRRPAVAVSADIHYSVSRVPGILGLGQEQIVRLPLNSRRQVCPDQARSTIEAARAHGLEVFCLVVSAGSTSIGAIDPLEALADYAQREGIWLHVDGAHGGAFLVSDSLRPRLAGIERADSFCLDAHKTLFVPAACTLLFYREAAKATLAFSQEASYVFGDQTEPGVLLESGAKTFECTKRPAILNLWLVWALYGRGLLAEKLEYLVALTEEVYDHLAATADFHPLHRPEANILCFEYRPLGYPLEARASSRLHLALRDGLRDGGRFFLSKVDLEGRCVLRLVFMNHDITLDHVTALLDELRHLGAALLKDLPQ